MPHIGTVLTWIRSPPLPTKFDVKETKHNRTGRPPGEATPRGDLREFRGQAQSYEQFGSPGRTNNCTSSKVSTCMAPIDQPDHPIRGDSAIPPPIQQNASKAWLQKPTIKIWKSNRLPASGC
jgi:hypothetical protein